MAKHRKSSVNRRTKSGDTSAQAATWRSKKLLKTAAMYSTMVIVSTGAIYLLEHATVLNAFRTALVAAVGKTIAANWVTGIFD